VSPYKLAGPVMVKVFSANSAAGLEQCLNEWLTKANTEYEVVNILYQYYQVASGEEIYSSLVSYIKKEFEESM
jgi:hypothetical protein